VLQELGACRPQDSGANVIAIDSWLTAVGWLLIDPEDTDEVAALDLDPDSSRMTLPGAVGELVHGTRPLTFRVEEALYDRAVTSATSSGPAGVLLAAVGDGLGPVITVYPDGGIGFVGPCALNWFTIPFYEHWTTAGESETPFDALIRVISDGTAMDALVTSVYGPGEEPAWDARLPDRRILDVEQTPRHVLDALEPIQIVYDVPPSWYGLSAVICTRISLGWNPCIDPAVGLTAPLRIEAFVDPVGPLDVYLLPPDGDVGLPLVHLQTIDLERHDVSGDRELRLSSTVDASQLLQGDGSSTNGNSIFTVGTR
jgi:hypothetical protein